MKIFFTSIAMFVCFISFAQKKFSFSNQVAFTLNGAGDLGGYKVDAVASWELLKKSDLIFKFGVSETKGDEVLLRYEQVYQNDAAITATFAFNRKIKLANFLNLEPEIGFILRSHTWTMLAGTALLIHGNRVIPAYGSAQWTDKTIGYHIQIPFVFKVSKTVSIPLFAEYENDTFGYTFFSVGTGVKFNIKR